MTIVHEPHRPNARARLARRGFTSEAIVAIYAEFKGEGGLRAAAEALSRRSGMTLSRETLRQILHQIEREMEGSGP